MRRLEEKNSPMECEDVCGLQRSAWWIRMGRSFESIRIGVKDVSARWLKASKALKKEDQVYGQRLAEMAKKHFSEAFNAQDDPLEERYFQCCWNIRGFKLEMPL